MSKPITTSQRPPAAVRNAYSAERGRQILAVYGDIPGTDHEPQFQLTDLLCDLMHLAHQDRPGLDFQRALYSAEQDYNAELAGEE